MDKAVSGRDAVLQAASTSWSELVMSIRPVTQYEVCCDGPNCLEPPLPGHYESQEQALQLARSFGYDLRGDQLLCNRCLIIADAAAQHEEWERQAMR